MDFFKAAEVFRGLEERDFGMYYNGVVIPLKHAKTGKVSVGMITGVGGRHFLFSVGGEEGHVQERADYLWPMGFNFRGYLNSEKFAAFISRDTKRQWKKGLTTDNTSIEIPYRHTVEKYYAERGYVHDFARVGTTLTRELNRLINNKPYYPTYGDAYNILERGERGSVAVSSSYAMAVEADSEHPYLLKDNRLVGWAHSDHVILSKYHNHLWPQIDFTDARGE